MFGFGFEIQNVVSLTDLYCLACEEDAQYYHIYEFIPNFQEMQLLWVGWFLQHVLYATQPPQLLRPCNYFIIICFYFFWQEVLYNYWLCVLFLDHIYDDTTKSYVLIKVLFSISLFSTYLYMHIYICISHL
jgi:hypothetical protein